MSSIATSLLVAWTSLAAASEPEDPSEKAEKIEKTQRPVKPVSLKPYYALIDAIGDHSIAPDPNAPELFDFLRAAPPTDERYAWAQLHLSGALRSLGFTHAAAVLLSQIATERTNPDVLPFALDQLRALSDRPHDEELVGDRVFGSLDVAFLPESTQRYAHYQQGLIDLKAGREGWANRHFSRLNNGSPEAARAEYAQLVTRLSRSESALPELIAGFEKLSREAGTPPRVRLEAQLAVARLRYEREDFQGALAAYDAVELPPLDPGRAALYMEEAWTQYRLGELEKAMGLLTTLDAPVFREEFLPDKYLLRAAIYRQRCHYLPASRAARELTRRYAGSIQAIQERKELVEDVELRRAAVAKGAAGKAEAFLNLLLREWDQLYPAESQLGSPLFKHLYSLYGVAIAEATRARDLRLRAAVDAEAERLLSAAEQVRLIQYEVGLQLYERIKKGDQTPVPPEENALGPDDVSYGFTGEYWNDELRNYRVSLIDRCSEGGS